MSEFATILERVGTGLIRALEAAIPAAGRAGARIIACVPLADVARWTDLELEIVDSPGRRALSIRADGGPVRLIEIAREGSDGLSPCAVCASWCCAPHPAAGAIVC